MATVAVMVFRLELYSVFRGLVLVSIELMILNVLMRDWNDQQQVKRVNLHHSVLAKHGQPLILER